MTKRAKRILCLGLCCLLALSSAAAEEAAQDMNEYLDSRTGFSMQYPAVFTFDDEGAGTEARTQDGQATLTVESLENAEGALTEAMILEAIRLEAPDAEPVRNEQTGCIRIDRELEGGRIRTDFYLVLKDSFHHVTMEYPAAERERYAAFADRMMASMGAGGNDLG